MRGQGNLPNIASDFSRPVEITRAQQFFPILPKHSLRSAIFSRPLEKNADLTTIEHRGRGEKEQPEVGPKGE
jgi:hypothetical protein